MFVDTHCHLFYNDYDSDFKDVINRAFEKKINCFIIPSTDLNSCKKSIELSEKYDSIHVAVGIHPHEVAKATEFDLYEIEKLSTNKKIVAIGEIGIDYHYDFSPKEIQKKLFETQIEIAIRKNLPIIIHERESQKDIFEIVKRIVAENPNWRKGNKKGVFHCFNGDTNFAEKVIDLGFMISFTGFITFKQKMDKINSMQVVAKEIPLEHIMLETDSPYLTPVPNRGKRNEPSNIIYIAQKISEIKNIPIETVAKITTENAIKFFNIKI